MKRPLLLLLGALLAATACGGPTPSQGRSFMLGGEAMTACTLAGGVAARCGVLKVAENRSAPSGRSIGIKVALLPALDRSNLQEPVFFISGGPGGSTIHDWSQANGLFPMLGVHRDVVLVDQRGTGGSNPLVFPPIRPDESVDAYARRALAAIDGDPRFYTTSVAMDDLDAVRSALGYESIDLYGGSYGATAVQYYLRQHGDHVHAAVLDGGTLLDVPVFELIAPNSQRALDDVLDRCRSDALCGKAFPDPAGELAAALARLANQPVTTGFHADGQAVVVDAGYLAGTIHNQLLSASGAQTIPSLIHRAALGDYDEVARAGYQPAQPTLAMSAVIRCSEAWARFDPDAVATAGAGSYLLASELGAARNQAQVCPLSPPGVVPADDGQPVHSTVPVLLLNGSDDPQDPPSNVAGAPEEMPNSVSIAVRGQGHTVGHLGCLPAVVVAFFDTAKVDLASARACAQRIPVPAFQLG
jgi:pimeloyl-ACP methyl ester carboxylesterase